MFMTKPLILLSVALGTVAVARGATLVSQYTFNGNATDAVGGRNLTTTGAVTYGTATINGTTLNTLTLAGNHDGNNAATRYLTYSGNLGVSPGSVTVSFWANGATMSTSYNDIVGLADSSNNGFKFETDNSGNANDGVTLYGGLTGNIVTPPSTTSGSEGAWHLYTFTNDGTTGRLYLDGALVGTTAVGSMAETATKLYVGTGFDSLVRGWNGSLADLRLYSGALTAGEVATLFNAVPEPSAYGLLGAGALVSAAVWRRRRQQA